MYGTSRCERGLHAHLWSEKLLIGVSGDTVDALSELWILTETDKAAACFVSFFKVIRVDTPRPRVPPESGRGERTCCYCECQGQVWASSPWAPLALRWFCSQCSALKLHLHCSVFHIPHSLAKLLIWFWMNLTGCRFTELLSNWKCLTKVFSN